MCNFAHLHCHSEYSMLDGYGSIESMVKRAVDLGQPSLAITDHGNVHGVIEFYRECNKYNIKPIIGIEAYITSFGVPMDKKDNSTRRSNHLLLLAANQTGYENIIHLSTASYLDGFYYRPRIDYQLLEKHKEGLIVTSGCMAAEIPQLIMRQKEGNPITDEHIDSVMDWYVSTFGEYFFVEVQSHPGIDELVYINKRLFELAHRFGTRVVATNDSHYPVKKDHDIHDILLCVQTGSSIYTPNRMKFSDNEYYIKSRYEMEKAFSGYNVSPDIFDNTLLITEMCYANPEIHKDSHHMPDIDYIKVINHNLGYEVPEEDVGDYESALDIVAYDGMCKIYGDDWEDNDQIVQRYIYEMDVIKQTGFAPYYLIIKDICDFAKSNNIIWNIRGSGTGSLICYALGMSFIDPIDKGLLFERFLNLARVTIPDIDLDFEDNKREQIIRHLIDKYGENRVTQVVTFGHMKSRLVVRDVGRALGEDILFVDGIARKIMNIPGKPITIDKSLDPTSEYHSIELLELYESEPKAKRIIDYGRRLENTIRQSGVHAAAVIVSDKDLTTYTPLMKANASITRHIAQYDYPTLESLGLLKIDCLGLATLSIINKACEIINDRHSKNLTPFNIPFQGEECQEAFNLLSAGETVGVFQVESAGLRKALMQMRPTDFNHIMDIISLYRPGPLQYIPEYIERFHGQQNITYRHPELEKHTRNTQGVMIYQEQIINVLSDLAGYTPGEADLVRKGISKKTQKIIDENRIKFIDGCVAKGIDDEIAAMIYDDIEKFSLYGFNKAHAASYARVTMQTAWLKANYPIEYMAACLIIEREKYDKVVGYIAECRRMGIPVLPPDINESGVDFTIVESENIEAILPASKYVYNIPEGTGIRFGLGSIKNVSYKTAEKLASLPRFNHINDLVKIPVGIINKRSLESLIGSGVFDSLYKDRVRLFINAESLMEQIRSARRIVNGGQKSMFVPQIRIYNTQETDVTVWDLEREYIGYWLTSHPTERHTNILGLLENTTLDVNEENSNVDITILVAASKWSEVYSRKGGKMVFATLSDSYGQCDAIVFPATYETIPNIVEHEVILVKGTVRANNGDAPILVINKVTNRLINTGVKYEPAPKPANIAETIDKKQVLLHNRYRTSAYIDANKLFDAIKEYLVDVHEETLIINLFVGNQPNGSLRIKNKSISTEDAKTMGLTEI